MVSYKKIPGYGFIKNVQIHNLFTHIPVNCQIVVENCFVRLYIFPSHIAHRCHSGKNQYHQYSEITDLNFCAYDGGYSMLLIFERAAKYQFCKRIFKGRIFS